MYNILLDEYMPHFWKAFPDEMTAFDTRDHVFLAAGV